MTTRRLKYGQKVKFHDPLNSACHKGLIGRNDFIELGEIIPRVSKGRTDDTQITIADLTDVAVQDIKIALCVYNACINN